MKIQGNKTLETQQTVKKSVSDGNKDSEVKDSVHLGETGVTPDFLIKPPVAGDIRIPGFVDSAIAWLPGATFGEAGKVLSLINFGSDDAEKAHVKGDFGEYYGDYTITTEGNKKHIKGDFGEYYGDYTVTTEGNTTTVKGDFGEYYGDFTITTEGNKKHIKGDFGEYYGEATITSDGKNSSVKGDFGEYFGEFTVNS